MNGDEQWQQTAHVLAQILRVPVEWGPKTLTRHRDQPSTFFHVLRTVDGEWGLWVEGTLTDREKRLLSWMTRVNEDTDLQPSRFALIDWIREVAQAGYVVPVPESLAKRVSTTRVPFYVTGHGTRSHVLREQDVVPVMRPFFNEQVTVLSVTSTELLIFPDASVVYEGDEAETWQDHLQSWAEGLADVFASELGEEVLVVVDQPVETTQALGASWLAMKQAAAMGTAFYRNRSVFTTWGMSVERLLYGVSDASCQAFLQDVATDGDMWWQDPEMRETLETFFALNLNVSETARQLYIHRNTLLYRLDKLKQETGRDVRQFEAALVIRLALLLTANSSDKG